MTEETSQKPIGCLGCLGRGLIVLFAVIGFLQVSVRLFGQAVGDFVISPFLEREITQRIPAPDKAAEAYIEVTRGLTVWTTRVMLVPKGREGWLVYKTKDSDYAPSLRWIDRDTLILGLGCEQFDFISNPDDWERSDTSERRYKVRVTYADQRCAPPTGLANAP